ncbi:MAG: ferrochelatase [Eggerthellaceae bacterium]|jgi:ferrochelatase|nr:ferrochelatase [Eggerthellaceae bacterium]MDR2716388.1 ferrochelatase [Coriobacteriaceae bacterium]
MKTQLKYGVILANTGTPAAPTPRAVRGYLSQFLMDRRIAPMNRAAWWLILHLFILPRRSKASAEKYEAVWTDEGSPFMVAHERLCAGLQRAYAKDAAAPEVVVAPGMSFGTPSFASALKGLREAGCGRVVVLPLYPQSAYSTTGSVRDALVRARKRLGWDVEVDIIDNYHDNPLWARTVAASIVQAGFDAAAGDRVLFSFHSIPLRDIEAGDSYELQCGASSLQIANELGIDRKLWTIGYQCRFDKGREWLDPFTKDVLDRWAEAGVGRVFLVCPGFSVDCLETIYDVRFEMKSHYLKACAALGNPAGEDGFIPVPCLDRTWAHVRVVQNVLRPYLKE